MRAAVSAGWPWNLPPGAVERGQSQAGPWGQREAQGAAKVHRLKKEKEKRERASLFFLSCEDTVRGQPSMNKDVS